jgi:hypothetical protein
MRRFTSLHGEEWSYASQQNASDNVVLRVQGRRFYHLNWVVSLFAF